MAKWRHVWENFHFKPFRGAISFSLVFWYSQDFLLVLCQSLSNLLKGFEICVKFSVSRSSVFIRKILSGSQIRSNELCILVPARKCGSGIRCFFDPGRSLETIFLVFYGIKYLNSLMRIQDPGWTVRIRDPGWKKVGSGIRDKHPGSATLQFLG